eukprot:9413587-Prorocentrum_lima.AAC.1
MARCRLRGLGLRLSFRRRHLRRLATFPWADRWPSWTLTGMGHMFRPRSRSGAPPIFSPLGRTTSPPSFR